MRRRIGRGSEGVLDSGSSNGYGCGGGWWKWRVETELKGFHHSESFFGGGGGMGAVSWVV